MQKFIKEFREFINRGSVVDMAVGMIIGGAFTGIVKSLVDDIINPILGLFGGMNFDQFSVMLGKGSTLNYGKFITAVINFLIMAFIVFLIVKMMNHIKSKCVKEHEDKEMTKKCPFCKSKIPIDAVKCPHCTSIVD